MTSAGCRQNTAQASSWSDGQAASTARGFQASNRYGSVCIPGKEPKTSAAIEGSVNVNAMAENTHPTGFNPALPEPPEDDPAIGIPPPAADQGPCLYFGPAGERCSRPAIDGGFCARHQPLRAAVSLLGAGRAPRSGNPGRPRRSLAGPWRSRPRTDPPSALSRIVSHTLSLPNSGPVGPGCAT